METEEKKQEETGVVSRLAGRGEEAMNRLMDELAKNSRVSEALARALAAKGMLDSASRTALVQVGLAPADEVRELRGRVHELEKRLAKLEGARAEEKASGRRTRAQKALPEKASPATSPEAPKTPRSTRSGPTASAP